MVQVIIQTTSLKKKKNNITKVLLPGSKLIGRNLYIVLLRVDWLFFLSFLLADFSLSLKENSKNEVKYEILNGIFLTYLIFSFFFLNEK